MSEPIECATCGWPIRSTGPRCAGHIPERKPTPADPVFEDSMKMNEVEQMFRYLATETAGDIPTSDMGCGCTLRQLAISPRAHKPHNRTCGFWKLYRAIGMLDAIVDRDHAAASRADAKFVEFQVAIARGSRYPEEMLATVGDDAGRPNTLVEYQRAAQSRSDARMREIQEEENRAIRRAELEQLVRGHNWARGFTLLKDFPDEPKERVLVPLFEGIDVIVDPVLRPGSWARKASWGPLLVSASLLRELVQIGTEQGYGP